MIIKNKIQIASPPDKIWLFITDPAGMKSWNPRIKAVVPVTVGEPRANSQYRIRYGSGREESNFLAEILEDEEYSRLVLHLTRGKLPIKGFIQEIYELTPNSSGVLLRQSILIEQVRLGIPAALLLRIRNLIGKSSARKYLAKLKALVEGLASA